MGLFTATSAILIKIHGFSSEYRILSAREALWANSKKPALTIYELKTMPKPSALVESHYVHSNSSERWFSIGILVSLLVVLCAPAVIGYKYIFFETPTKEQLVLILLLQITVISISALWLYKCFGAMQKHSREICELKIHTANGE